MVVWAANFIVVKDVITVLPPVGFTFLRYALASIALLVLLRWSARARSGSRAATPLRLARCSAASASGSTRSCGRSGCRPSRPATRPCSSPRRRSSPRSSPCSSGRTSSTGPGRSASLLSFLGVVLVIGAGVGIELSGSPIGFALTLARGAVLGDVHGHRRARAAPGVAARADDLGDDRRDARPGARSASASSLAPGALDDAQGPLLPIVLAIAYSGLLAAALANVIVFDGVRLLGPTRITTIQALVPAMAVVLAYLFLQRADPAGPGPRRRDHRRSASALTRRQVGRPPMSADVRCRRVPPLRDGEPPLALLIDYDGTISLTDVTDEVMAEHVPGVWEEAAARYDAGLMGSRRLMGLEMDLVRRGSRRRCSRPRPSSPTTRGSCPSSGAPRRPASRSRSCPTGSASSSSRRWSALGVPGADRRHRPDDVAGRPPDDRLPERPPALPRLRDVQARPGPGPSRGRPPGRVHRRRRERPLCGRLQRRSSSPSARSSASAWRRAGRSALDALRGDRRLAGRDPGRLRAPTRRRCRGSRTARRRRAGSSAARGLGRGPGGPTRATPGPAPDVAGRTVRGPRDANRSKRGAPGVRPGGHHDATTWLARDPGPGGRRLRHAGRAIDGPIGVSAGLRGGRRAVGERRALVAHDRHAIGASGGPRWRAVAGPPDDDRGRLRRPLRPPRRDRAAPLVGRRPGHARAPRLVARRPAHPPQLGRRGRHRGPVGRRGRWLGRARPARVRGAVHLGRRGGVVAGRDAGRLPAAGRRPGRQAHVDARAPRRRDRRDERRAHDADPGGRAPAALVTGRQADRRRGHPPRGRPTWTPTSMPGASAWST